jgi:hypothetical protein
MRRLPGGGTGGTSGIGGPAGVGGVASVSGMMSVPPTGGGFTPTPDASTECPSIGRTTMPQLGAADVVWIIDGSGSMVDEAERLQQNLDSFTTSIADAGVDTRVVLLAQDDLVPAGSALAQSGNYLFVEADVDSYNALDILVSQFASYSTFLRPQAHVHFIAVTDDESRYMGLGTPAERATGFQGAMDGLLSGEYTVHTVASPGAVGEAPCVPESVTQEILDCCVACLFCLEPPMGCEHLLDANGAPLINTISCAFLGGAAAPGVTYYALAEMTAGVATSICVDDWTDVFGSLSDAVIESVPLPCSYPIPEPPSGMFFDRDKVNVRFTPTGMSADETEPFPKVGAVDACADEAAWYYDNPDAPAEVLLCPASCEAVASEGGGTMEIVFGCETVVVD